MSQKKDMYKSLMTALKASDAGIYASKLKGFMVAIKRRERKLSLAEIRQIADEISYDFLLDLIDADELFTEVNDDEFNANFVDEVVSIFLQTKTIGRRRAVL